MMKSGFKSRVLKPIPGSSYDFVPFDSSVSSGKTTGTLLYELVVLPESPERPVDSICEKDGRYLTGDLFEKTKCGGWLSRGRVSDWIPVGNGLRCDTRYHNTTLSLVTFAHHSSTRSIEAHVLRTCAHAVSDCVVVGSGRPYPALVIELAHGLDKSDQIRHQIARDMRLEQAGFLPHETIGADFILLAVAGSLPRTLTKRNIQRHVVEELYRFELDRLYEPVGWVVDTSKSASTLLWYFVYFLLLSLLCIVIFYSYVPLCSCSSIVLVGDRSSI